MQINSDAPLQNYSTMRLGGTARAVAEAHNKDELLEALEWAHTNHLSTLILGGGSNVIFKNDYPGLLILNRLSGFEVLQQDTDGAVIKVGAGENWDSVVARTVDMGLSGIEKLSAIPGTAGATPVQNVGAYGAEIADVFVELEAYDMQTNQFVILTKDDCHFGYRTSIFKSLADRRYIITSVTLKLSTQPPRPPFYASLQKYLDQRNITDYTPRVIRDAVVAIRRTVLPDPSQLANTGSFFKNPILPASTAAALRRDHPDMPQFPTPNGQVKIPAGWLIDHAGLKGYRAHGMRTYEHNALVLINEQAQNYQDLAAFKQKIIDRVRQKFGITLQQEPELIEVPVTNPVNVN